MMISSDEVRALALALPQVEDRSTSEHLAFTVAGKGFAWSWMERASAGAPRRPRLDVLAVRCRAEEKEMIVEADPAAFVSDDHYRGYPAVLVRLDRIASADLAALLAVAWRCRAPKTLIRAVDSGR